MPELPEVETIRLGLQKYLVGHTIENIEVRLPRIVIGDVKDIVGATITGVRRFGKGLVIDLDTDYLIAIHIKMTGQLIYKNQELRVRNQEVKIIRDMHSFLPNKWTHVIFTLDRGATLYYNDFRQFGWIKIVKSEKLKAQSFFKDLGPEFLKDLSLKKFTDIVKKSTVAIKPLIMDQKKIAGLGNIYANDGLNLAMIDSRRKASSLTQEEIEDLFQALETVLKKGIIYGGASELSFVNVLGGEGKYQEHFLVYGRKGKPCFNCGGIIEKIKLGGRGTYFCPKCQK